MEVHNHGLLQSNGVPSMKVCQRRIEKGGIGYGGSPTLPTPARLAVSAAKDAGNAPC